MPVPARETEALFSGPPRLRFFGVTWLLSVLIMLMLPCAARAQFTYTQSNGTITITGYTGSGGEVAIPGTINTGSSTLPVTAIGPNAFNACISLSTLTIPSGVVTIGTDAFSGCNSLTLLTLPNTITSIGSYAFYGCWSLTSVTIPSSMTTIASNAFNSCRSLTSLTIPNNITSIGADAFYNCTDLTNVTISGSVTSISTAAFENCTELTSATFLGNAPTMSPLVFYTVGSGFTVYYLNGATGFTSPTWNGYATQLAPLTIATASPLPVGTVGADYSQAFAAAGSLTSYTWSVTSGTLPAGLALGSSGLLSGTPTAPGVYNFTAQVRDSVATASQAMSLTVPNPDPYTYSAGNNSVVITGYSGSGGNVTIPATINGLPVTAIQPYAFENSALSGVTIPSGVTSIGASAFEGCLGLVSATIPSTVTSIGTSAFQNCGLASIIIPNGVTTIGPSAFADCWALASVTIPNSVTSIGDYAFSSCWNLSAITLPSGLTSIGNGVFEYCTGVTSAAIPGGVAPIGNSAFLDCASLASLTLPGTVTSIGPYAFESTALTSGTIPGSVTSIGNDAFADCPGLFGAWFLGNTPTMGGGVFMGAAVPFTVYYYNNKSGFSSPQWNDGADIYAAVDLGDSSPAVAAWLQANGLPYNVNLNTAPNGDGVTLLMDYALNLNPNQPEGGAIPRPAIDAGNLSLTFYAGSSGVTYYVQSSTDLRNWSTTGVSVSAPNQNDFSTATMSVTGSCGFMRIEIVH